MSLERVSAWLEEKGYGDRIQVFDVSSATVSLAAKALGCEEGHIAKTLSFLVNGKAVLLVCAGDRRVDNGKFKAFFQVRAKMIPLAEVEDKTGHAAGGVCPFAVKPGIEVYLDGSLQEQDTIYPAAGTSNSAVRLTPHELETILAPVTWVDVCKV